MINRRHESSWPCVNTNTRVSLNTCIDCTRFLIRLQGLRTFQVLPITTTKLHEMHVSRSYKFITLLKITHIIKKIASIWNHIIFSAKYFVYRDILFQKSRTAFIPYIFNFTFNLLPKGKLHFLYKFKL